MMMSTRTRRKMYFNLEGCDCWCDVFSAVRIENIDLLLYPVVRIIFLLLFSYNVVDSYIRYILSRKTLSVVCIFACLFIWRILKHKLIVLWIYFLLYIQFSFYNNLVIEFLSYKSGMTKCIKNIVRNCNVSYSMIKNYYKNT